MRIVVCIKQVPDINKLDRMETDPETGVIKREGLPSITNPDDESALEAALKIKEANGAEVIALTMGPPQAEEALIQAMGMGVDQGILVSDRAFAGADTLATSYTLAGAIKQLGKVDLILCGLQAIDGDTAQVGPMLAESLNLPQVTYVDELMLENKKFIAWRRLEKGRQQVAIKAPVLMTVVSGDEPVRSTTYANLSDALAKGVTTMTAAELDLDQTRLGLSGSPTAVAKVWTPEAQAGGETLDGDPAVIAERLADILLERLGRG